MTTYHRMSHGIEESISKVRLCSTVTLTLAARRRHLDVIQKQEHTVNKYYHRNGILTPVLIKTRLETAEKPERRSHDGLMRDCARTATCPPLQTTLTTLCTAGPTNNLTSLSSQLIWSTPPPPLTNRKILLCFPQTGLFDGRGSD